MQSELSCLRLGLVSRLLGLEIDGVTTCAIERSYVPSHPVYFVIDINVGANDGVVSTSWPWSTLGGYVKTRKAQP